MTTSTPAAPARPAPTLDNSSLGVALVAVMLGLVSAVILLLWLQLAPPPPAANDRYFPPVPGASTVTRITNMDGSITYRSRNIHRAHANNLGIVEPASFDALTITLSAGAAVISPTQLSALLAPYEVLEIRDVEADAGGSTKSALITRGLLRNGGLEQYSVGNVSILPPIPLLPASAAVETFEGKLNESVPYRLSQQIDQRGARSTAVGDFPDCIRVNSELTINQDVTKSLTWYCAGVGEVSDESTSAAGVRRSEIIAASVGPFVRGENPVLPDAGVNASLAYVFPEPIKPPFVRELDYQEGSHSGPITTYILPVGNLVLYGTQSGALVAVDRRAQMQAWRFQTGGAIYSTPTVANGIAYFGSADRKVYAVRASDGAFVWAYLARDVISSPPAVDSGTVYFSSEDRNVYAVDADTGRLRWTFPSGSPFIASPVVNEGLVFVSNSAGTLFALEQATGKLRWKFSAASAITAPVTVQEDTLYFGSHDETVYALSKQDGSVRWSRNVDKPVRNAVVVAGNRVYVPLPQEIFALDGSTGAPLWHYDDTLPLYGSPLLLGDRLWNARSGSILLLDPNTGNLVQAIPTTDTSADAGLSGDGSEVFIGFFEGRVFGFVGAGQ